MLSKILTMASRPASSRAAMTVASKDFSVLNAAMAAQAHPMADFDWPSISGSKMKILDGEIDTSSDDYRLNYEAMLRKNEELDRITAEIMDVGDKYRTLSKKRDKLLPRDRVNAIIDKGTPFLELS